MTGELQLDLRSKPRFDYHYQRWDTIHTGDLQLHATLDPRTQAGVLVRRRYFATRTVEAQAERRLSERDSLKVGLQKLPFGIYDSQETYRSGLIDYPMPRVDYGTSGIDQAVRGVGATVRRGRLLAEGAAFSGPGVTVWNGDLAYRGGVGRVQMFLPPSTIVGLSRCSESQVDRGDGSRRAVSLNGVDLRYARPFLVLRGEAIQGTIERRAYRGFYLDAYYRLPGLPAWTLTARGERLKPDPDSAAAHQSTLGARYTLDPRWTLTVNWRSNNINARYPSTWVPQSGRRGTVLLQVYHTIPLGK